MYRRNLAHAVKAALADTPVVFLAGARQTGKSTLAKALAARRGGHYVTLDDATVLAAASGDAAGFIRGLEGFVVIDEVQKAPQLFPAIKAAVDSNRRPGRFLLTGSANVLLLPRASESLAGRMEVLTLAPLSQGERQGLREAFIDGVFMRKLPMPRGLRDKESLARLLVTGGYPEVVARRQEQRQQAWFGAYLTAILQRDVRELANIEGLVELPRLLKLLAARTSGLLNYSELSRSSQMAQSTLKRYIALLETVFLFQPLQAWSANLGKRLIKSPKIHLVDTGLAAYLAGYGESRLKQDSSFYGHLLEAFVVAELRKQMSWSRTRVSLFHYRTTTGREVDVIIEDAEGRIVGIEVKAAATLTQRDLAGLRSLAEECGKHFRRGVVLYGGDELVPFSDTLCAMPVGMLWRITDSPTTLR